MPFWCVKGRENFPLCSGYTKAKEREEAIRNVGWRNGLRGGDLEEFVGTAMASEVVFIPKQTLQEPKYTLEDLLKCVKFLEEVGIDHSAFNKMLEEEIEKAREAEKEQQLFLFFPPIKK